MSTGSMNLVERRGHQGAAAWGDLGWWALGWRA
jgi:hypothetical protein